MSFGIVWYPANLEVYIYRPIESSNFKRVFWEGGMILKEESSVRVRCSFRCLMSVVGRVTS